MTTQPLVSIIIRTKNEERWIKLCLDRIFEQTYKNFEIIIVDNYSTDKTLQKIKDYKINKIIKIRKYLPGKAINLGIKNSNGKYIVIISAHCIPTTKNWLNNFIKSIHNKKNIFAGVYGRQEPMNFSNSNDKRDMFLLFGLDRKIQKKDSFFHNANSCIRKSVWKKSPFNEEISNIEDRLWGQEIIKKGYQILYEPNASVFHFHGVNQNNHQGRLSNIISIVDNHIKQPKGTIDPLHLNVVAVIPIKGFCKKIKNKYLIEYTIKNLKESKYVKKIFVSTDNEKTRRIAIKFGAETPFLRVKKYSKPEINLETVQQYTLFQLEKNNIFPDLFLHLQETFPFRDIKLIDMMINKLLNDGLDSIVAAKREINYVWKDKKDKFFTRIDSGDVPRKFKEVSMIGYPGIACITYPEFVRNRNLLGKNIGLFEIKNQLSFIEVRDKYTYDLAGDLLSDFQKYFK